MSGIPERLASAVQHHQAGRLAEAEVLYRGVLREAPQHPHALHLLGVLAQHAGRHHDAIDLIQKALAAHGPHPEFHNNLGAAYFAAGRLAEAEAHYRAAVRLKPDYADAYCNLGVVLRKRGQLPDAVSAFQETLRLNPNHTTARHYLETDAAQSEAPPDLLANLRERVRRDPGDAHAQHELGVLLIARDQAESALPHLSEAVRLWPEDADALCNLGVAQRQLHRMDEALDSFRAALRLSPENVMAHNHLAFALEALGRIGEAVAEYRETLRLDPNNAQAIFLLSELAVAGHHRFSDEEMRHIRELAAREDLPAHERTQLHFALGRLFDKAGDTAAAFAHYSRGNELRKEIDARGGAVYDPATQSRLVDRLIATFTPAYFERVRSFGVDTELPVFIVGMPRSGTTLAEQILASHPLVHGAGELQDVDRLIALLPGSLCATEGYPQSAAGLGEAAAVRLLAEGHLRRLRQLGGTAERVIDKLPFNFLNLGILAVLFPKAKYIHCRRDAVDTCLSCFFQNFGSAVPFSLDLRHLGHYYREYERLMAHWRKVLPSPLFELSYEELTTDQEAVSRRLVDFCGLEWDARCLRFHETQRVVRTASIVQVRQPLYRSAVGRWQRYATHLAPLLEALNEPRPSGSVSARAP